MRIHFLGGIFSTILPVGSPTLATAASGRLHGKDAETLEPHSPTRGLCAPRVLKVPRTAAAMLLFAVALCGALRGRPARGEIEPPVGDPRAPITVRAGQSQRSQEGAYVVWVLHGGCEIRQGPLTARSRDAVLWIDPGEPLEGEPSKIIAYLENDVWIDCAREGPPHRRTGRPAQSITGRTWLGRFHTTAGIDIDAPLTGPPAERPLLVQRGLEALEWNRREPVLPAQFVSPVPGPSPRSRPAARSVRIRSRSNVRMEAKSIPSPDPQETIVAITNGVQVVVGGIENVQGIETGVVTIEADRVVLWTTALVQPNLTAETIQPADGRWEFYLEGNIIFREGDRVIYADRMYYHANANQGMILNAEVLTPVPDYAGLMRLKADVLQQMDRQHFLAYGAAVTSSRLGVPSYWVQAENLTFEDAQRSRVDPFTGQVAIDPETGGPAVEHELLATSRNNFLYVGGIPVLYWPVIATDLRKPTYYIDGLRLGHDRVFGTQAMVDWDAYQLLGIQDPPAGTKWTVSTDWLGERGFGLGTNFRYAGDHFLGIPGPVRGSADAWGIDDHGRDNLGFGRRELIPEEDPRGRVLWQHRQSLPQGFQFTGELGFISDRNFLEQFYEHEWYDLKDQTTGIELNRYTGNRAWSITSDVRLNDFLTQTEWLPRFDHYLLGQSLLFDWLTWHAHSQVGYAHLRTAVPPSPINPSQVAQFHYLPWEVESEGLRAATRQELSLPLRIGPLKVVPYVLGDATYWGEDLSGQDAARVYGQAGVRAALPFWRVDPSVQSLLWNLNGLAHKVVFDVDCFYANASRDLAALPLYDPLDDDAIEQVRRLTADGYPGDVIPLRFDERYYALRSGMQSWVTAPSAEVADDLLRTRVGIRQRWQTKRGLPGRERIVDWIVFDVEGVVFPNSGEEFLPGGGSQDFREAFGLLDYAFRWHVGDRVTLLSDGFADFFDSGLQSFSVGGTLTRPERGNVYVGYRSIRGPVHSDILAASVGYRMSEKWVLAASTSIDLDQSGAVGQSIAVTRIGESALLRVGCYFDESRDNLGVNLAIEPRFLPHTRLGTVGGVQIPPAGAYGLE